MFGDKFYGPNNFSYWCAEFVYSIHFSDICLDSDVYIFFCIDMTPSYQAECGEIAVLLTFSPLWPW